MHEAPYSSTGSTNTWDKTLIACVDWFSATFFGIKKYEDVIHLLFLNSSDFEVKETGKFGYLKSAVCGHIKIYFGAANEKMGVHLEMSGSGCREYEENFTTAMNWTEFFKYVIGYNMQVTRLDLALDDFDGRFKLRQIKNKIVTGCVVSPFKKGRSFEEYLLHDGALIGNTIYFGKGDVVIRFYDKYQERINKGYEIDEQLKTWQRTEVQIRHERATQAVKLMAHNPDGIGFFIAGVLKRYLKFKIKGTDTNRSRWNDCRWWTNFLSEAETVKLTQVAPEKSILRTKDWLDTQVAGSLATVYEAVGNDDIFTDYMLALGKSKMTDEHKKMARDFSKDLTKRIALKEDLRRAVEEINKKKLPIKSEKFDDSRA